MLVAPQHNPLYLAHALASLDVLSGGRLTLGVGVGWSAAEFEALGADFATRGARTDEIIDAMRACWTQDPVTFEGRHVRFRDLRVLPQPERPIPIWVGGAADAAIRRGTERGDGFQLIGLTPAQAGAMVSRLREQRPEPEFTISLRTGWDPQGMEVSRIHEEIDAFADAGVQHVVAAPWRNDLDAWLASMDLLQAALEEH